MIQLLDLDQKVHCLLYTSDAADEQRGVDLGGRRISKKKKKKKKEKKKKKKNKNSNKSNYRDQLNTQQHVSIIVQT